MHNKKKKLKRRESTEQERECRQERRVGMDNSYERSFMVLRRSGPR